MNKRGISPLIATVLLIAFSVALGAVVMNWGRTFVGDQTKSVQDKSTKQLLCTTDILFNWVAVSNVEKIDQCTNGNLEIIIENIGGSQSEGVYIRAINASGEVFSKQFTEPLASGQAKKFVLTAVTDINGTIEYVSAQPMVFDPGTTILSVCSSNKIESSRVYTGNC